MNAFEGLISTLDRTEERTWEDWSIESLKTEKERKKQSIYIL